MAKERIGFYASTPAYWPVLNSEGVEEIGPKLRELTRQGKWSQMSDIVPNSLVDACCLSGTYDQIAEEILRKVGAQIDTILVSQSYEKQVWLPTKTIEDIQKLLPHLETIFKKIEKETNMRLSSKLTRRRAFFI